MSFTWLLAGVERPLLRYLKSIRPSLAAAAQEVYNEWQQDEEGVDEELGSGGICDRLSQQLSSAIAEGEYPDGTEFSEGGQEGDDHAFLIVYDEHEAYGVDIPYGLYEEGGGYNWHKKENVVFQPSDVQIFEVPHPQDQ